jgi:hypothetical protein
VKKIGFLLIISLLLITHSFSQGYMYNRGLVSLSIGLSIPSYGFGNNDGINLSSYAKLGTTISGEVSYFSSKHVGFGFILNYNVNPIDDDKLANAYRIQSPAFIDIDVTSKPFSDIAGVAGFIFDMPFNDYVSFTVRMMGGLRNVYKPSVLIQTKTIYTSIDYYETHTNDVVFAFLFGFGVKYAINDIMNVHFNSSYMGSMLELDYMRNKREVNQEAHLGALSLLFGASYAF